MNNVEKVTINYTAIMNVNLFRKYNLDDACRDHSPHIKCKILVSRLFDKK